MTEYFIFAGVDLLSGRDGNVYFIVEEDQRSD